MSKRELPKQFEVAIVSAGASGIYTAWRLLTSDVQQSPRPRVWSGDGKLKVAIFEGSNRVGGCLVSAQPPDMPNVTCELGGMRYVSSQKLVRCLVENVLKLARHEQVVDVPENVAYLRGNYLRLSQVADPTRLPYQLREAEATALGGQSPVNLIVWAIHQILPGVLDVHGADLLNYPENAKVDGALLYQHGFWNLLARAMSNNEPVVQDHLILLGLGPEMHANGKLLRRRHDD